MKDAPYTRTPAPQIVYKAVTTTNPQPIDPNPAALHANLTRHSWTMRSGDFFYTYNSPDELNGDTLKEMTAEVTQLFKIAWCRHNCEPFEDHDTNGVPWTAETWKTETARLRYLNAALKRNPLGTTDG